jgi:hypothetical protein
MLRACSAQKQHVNSTRAAAAEQQQQQKLHA